MESIITEKPGAVELVEDSSSSSDRAARLDDEVFANMATTLKNFGDLNEEAYRGTQYEAKMSVWQAVRMYPKAAAFSMLFSLSLVMEGYDTSLLGSFFGFPVFQKKFGHQLADGSYQLSATWQSGLQNGVQVGEILGLWAAGSIAHRFGYKKTMGGALIMMIAVIFIMFFAQNIGMLFAGEILCGLPWGAFQTLTTTYAAEISPMQLRPFLTTYVNMCVSTCFLCFPRSTSDRLWQWVIGQLISAGVLRGLLHRTDEWGWRIPYALQWVFPLPILIAVILAPEVSAVSYPQTLGSSADSSA